MASDRISIEWHLKVGDVVALANVRVGNEDILLPLKELRALKDFLGALDHDQINDIFLNPDTTGYEASISKPTKVSVI